MLIFANVLALALIAVDEPKTPTAPRLVTPGSSGPVAEEVWHLSLREAIRIGLDNSEVVRVITMGAQGKPVGGFEPTPLNAQTVGTEPPQGSSVDITIAPLNHDASIWNFKSAIMAHVRSVEQQYWALAYLQTTLWARENAVRLGEQILRRERADAALELHGGGADVAEAEQQLENFKLNLVTATSDLITAERQLRNILGLPPADNRRIVAETRPTEARLEPEWEACVHAMEASQPDLAQQRRLVQVAELKALIEGEDPNLSPERREASRNQLERQKAFLQQIRHQTTHSVARFFLEIDANYKQYQSARNLRVGAQKRLEAQRAIYEEGRITVDRLLDAVNQYANATSQEAQFRSTYNTSIAALEEAKGTLLDHDKITVVEGPSPKKTDSPAKVDAVTPASYQAPTPATPAAATMYKLRAKIGDAKVLEIEVEVNQAAPAKP